MPDGAKSCIAAPAPETPGYKLETMTTITYVTILVTGADARDFLQGQLTADLARMTPGAGTLAAWCNPKGRVICLFRLREAESGFRLTLPAELAEEVVRRLTLYRFRSKVEFATEGATTADLAIGETGDGPGSAAAAAPAGDDLQAWRLENLRRGIPEIGPAQTEKFTPHMLNLDLLGAISLDKGCYTGQEVVARTHYRGATRRRTLRFEAAAPVAVGAKLAHGDRDIGEILNAIGTDALAVVPVDCPAAGLTAAGVALTRAPLPYMD